MRLGVVGVVVTVLLLCAPGTLRAQQIFHVTSSAGANVRSRPSTSAPVITTLARETTVPFVGREGQWVHVEVIDRNGGRVSGYILGTLGLVERDPQYVPPAAPVAQPPAPSTAVTPAPPPAVTQPASPPVVATPSAAPTQVVQSAPSPSFSKREPVVSLILSLVYPGLGQFYNGPSERKKGLIMAAGGAAALMMVMTGCNGSYGSSCGQAYVGLFAYMGLEIYSGYDAATNAGKINRARGLAFSVTPERQAGETSVRASATYSIDF